MNKIYIYEHHNGFDIYLSSFELNPEEIYCNYCGVSDKLIASCDNEQSLKDLLYGLTKEYSIIDRGYYGGDYYGFKVSEE